MRRSGDDDGDDGHDDVAVADPAPRRPPRLPDYAELHCRSNFSFLTGASQPGELVRRAQSLGYTAIAITDECSFAGVVRAHVEAQACGMHLVVGAEMRLTLPAAEGGAAHARLVLLAQDRRGAPGRWRPNYLPLKSGSRFSAKARRPSIRSSVANASTVSSCSIRSPSLNR